MGTLSLTKAARNGEKTFSSVSGDGKTLQLCVNAKEWN